MRFSILLIVPLLFSFQNCSKIGTETQVGGEMTQHIAIDMPQLKLEDLVKGYYESILGREPTASELASAVQSIRAGLSGPSLQQQLANSTEAITKLTELLFQSLGNLGTQNLTYWLNLLQSGTSLAQIKTLLGIQ